MIEEQGTVTVRNGDRVLVSSFAPHSCGGCHNNEACGTASLARFFRQRRRSISAYNRAGARPGDLVIVGIDEHAMLRAAFIAYALPLFGLLAGALIGQGLASANLEEPTALLAGLTGLLAGLRISRRVSVRMANNEYFQASVLRVITATHSGLSAMRSD